MNAEILSEITADQREWFLGRQQGTPRRIDLPRLLDTPQIVVISGVRRCGKSTLLRQVAGSLGNAFHYLNLDDERLLEFGVQDFEALMLTFAKRSEDKTLLIDEIQNVPQWERFVRRVHDQGYKVFLTGSNARLLSSELGTHLTGRYTLIELFPFSFSEALQFQGVDPERRSTPGRAAILKAFDRYLEDGGFPEFLTYGDRELLARTYDDILHRDIVSRFGIREVGTFRQLAHYLFTNVTGDMTYNKLHNVLGISSASTVRDYIDYLQQSYLAFPVFKYDFSLKKQHVSSKKVYVIDNGMRNVVAFRFSSDSGKLLENTVFVELRRRGGDVYFHRNDRECDFVVVRKGAVREAYQVCYGLTDTNKTREIRGLESALRQFGLAEGTVLTYNRRETIDLGDNRLADVRPAWEWLLER